MTVNFTYGVCQSLAETQSQLCASFNGPIFSFPCFSVSSNVSFIFQSVTYACALQIAIIQSSHPFRLYVHSLDYYYCMALCKGKQKKIGLWFLVRNIFFFFLLFVAHTCIHLKFSCFMPLNHRNFYYHSLFANAVIIYTTSIANNM